MESPGILARTVTTEKEPDAVTESEPGSESESVSTMSFRNIMELGGKISGSEYESSSDVSEYYDCVEKPEELKAEKPKDLKESGLSDTDKGTLFEGTMFEGTRFEDTLFCKKALEAYQPLGEIEERFVRDMLEMKEYRRSHTNEFFPEEHQNMQKYYKALMDLTITVLQRKLVAGRLTALDCHHTDNLTFEERRNWNRVDGNFSHLMFKLFMFERAFNEWEKDIDAEELCRRFWKVQLKT
ncbi:MAG: hypothetical protein Q9224_004885 [Gallowayella concinna]